MSGSALIVWTLPFTSRVIRAMGACLPGDAASWDRRAPAPRPMFRPGVPDLSWVATLVHGAAIGNSLTRLCCGGGSRAKSTGTRRRALPRIDGQRAHRSQQVAHLRFRNAAGDEHEPAGAVLAGPGRELDRRMGEVLDHV